MDDSVTEIGQLNQRTQLKEKGQLNINDLLKVNDQLKDNHHLKDNDWLNMNDQLKDSDRSNSNVQLNIDNQLNVNDHLKILLELCANRDQVAFKQLYDVSCGQLYATLSNILRVEAVAEEALQEAYVRIWDKASEYKPELGQPLTWMTSIARYHAQDVLRKHRNRENKDVELGKGLPGMKPADSQTGTATTKEYRALLEQCFGRLSQNQRECITRAYVEGLTHEELSQSLSSSVGTTKSWIRRGLVTLKECVRELS